MQVLPPARRGASGVRLRGARAVAFLGKRLGADPSGWRWERLHRAVFPHDVFHEVRLLRRETLDEIATLTPPEPGIIMDMQFSPDGRHLYVGVVNTIHVWDLHALRRGLGAVGLDWDPAP